MGSGGGGCRFGLSLLYRRMGSESGEEVGEEGPLGRHPG